MDFWYRISNKPYKTLPQDQTTRVYDKVPIKALSQELISNRIVYGNYLQGMTPPSSIEYTANWSPRDMQTSDYATQYPYSNVKQNRTYQVGFVLADYYGRQSDVILSTHDNPILIGFSYRKELNDEILLSDKNDRAIGKAEDEGGEVAAEDMEDPEEENVMGKDEKEERQDQEGTHGHSEKGGQ